MKLQFAKPILLLMYGLPGAGKSSFARMAAAELGIAHVSSDRIRYELYDDPHYTPSENNTVLRLAGYMAEELLKSGQSIIFDMHLPTQKLRGALRQMAQENDAVMLIVWVQTDPETAAYRAMNRDRRRADDRYSFSLSAQQFEALASAGGPSERERTVVISGKHLFKFQLAAVVNKLTESGLAGPAALPGSRVDYARRAIKRM